MQRRLDYYPEISKSSLRKHIIEIIGPTKYWPKAIRLSFVKRHWRNRERFKILVFMLVNGVDPRMYISYLTKTGGYDRSAWDQVMWIIKKYPTSNWTAWHVALRRTQ